MKTLLKAFALLAVSSQLMSCGHFLESLRRGVDEQPEEVGTVGGRWHERGYLYQDRAPASAGGAQAEGGETWVSGNQNSQRDALRGTPTYSENPNVLPSGAGSYRNGFRATRADFIDDKPSEGSLWSSSGQTNYYVTKNKMRSVGDIVSINVEDPLLKDIASEIKRGLVAPEQDQEIAVAQEKLRRQAYGIKDDAPPGAAPEAARAPASAKPGEEVAEVQVPTATANDVNVANSIELKTGDSLMAEIVERFPNGNYRLRGVKRVVYKYGPPRLVTIVGIAKSSDISDEDVLNSGKIHEYRIEAHR